jgi:hypothetical protein
VEATTNPVDDLVLDLLEWLAVHPRHYAEVMEAWRTSCPRLPVWEEANARGFVTIRRDSSGLGVVGISDLGLEHVLRSRPRCASGD